MITIFIIGFGGALGAVTRFGFVFWVTKILGKTFPYGLLLVNISGCLLIGILAAYFQKERFFGHLASLYLRNLLITGFLGGFTTFSSFSLDALMLLQKGSWLKAFFYIGLSVFISLIAVALGFFLVKRYF